MRCPVCEQDFWDDEVLGETYCGPCTRMVERLVTLWSPSSGPWDRLNTWCELGDLIDWVALKRAGAPREVVWPVEQRVEGWRERERHASGLRVR